MVDETTGRLIILSITFACAIIVLAYRDFALAKGWAMGEWNHSDTSWLKLLAGLCLLGAPVVGSSKVRGGSFF